MSLFKSRTIFAVIIFVNSFVTLPVLHRIFPCTEYSPPMSQSPDAGHTIPVYGVPICIPARSVPASAEASPDRACASAALSHREVRKYKCPPINEALRHILKIFPCHVCWFHLLIALLSVYPHPRHEGYRHNSQRDPDNASVPVVRYQRTNHYKECGKLHG